MSKATTTPSLSNSLQMTMDTTKVDQSPNFLGEYTPHWTTRRIKASEMLQLLGWPETEHNLNAVRLVRIDQEGKGNWAAHVDGSGEYVSGGESLKACWAGLLTDYFQTRSEYNHRTRKA